MARGGVGANELLEFLGAQAVGFGEDMSYVVGLGNVARGAHVDEVDGNGVEGFFVEGRRSAVMVLPVTQPGVIEGGVRVVAVSVSVDIHRVVGEHVVALRRGNFYVMATRRRPYSSSSLPLPLCSSSSSSVPLSSISCTLTSQARRP